MLLLSRVAGIPVRGFDGTLVGRLADLTVRLGDRVDTQPVERIVVGRRGRPVSLLGWEAVAAFQSRGVTLALPPAQLPVVEAGALSAALDADEILLVRDVLDTQVVDVVGQRLARVADVVLARTAGGRLEVLGVEVGFSGVLRRLGIGSRATRAGEDLIAWSDLHLTSERGHAVQLATPRSAVHRLDARGLAALVSRVDTESATEILAIRDPRLAADVLRVSHPAVGERVLLAMSDIEAAQIVAAMPVEHARRWRALLAHRPVLPGRRFLRSHVWPRRRHHPQGPTR